MNEVRLDLFKLHDESDKGQGRIKAELNPKLKAMLRRLVRELKLKKKIKIKDIAKQVGLPYSEFWRCLQKTRIPIVVIVKLLEFWSKITSTPSNMVGIKLQDEINKLSHGAGNTYKKVYPPRFLSEDLCKIVGAIIADGHLRHRKLKSGMFEYTIVVRDGFKDNLDSFCSWVSNEFEVELTPKYSSKDHHWYVSFGNKIIFRYINKLFGVQFGKKSDIVRMPDVIKDSGVEFKRAFATGVLMFDGGVDHRTGYFDFTTKSRQLMNDIKNILLLCGIEPDYVSDELDLVSGVYKLRIRQRRKLKGILDFLEPGTTRWIQLNSHINGIEKSENLDDLIERLKLVYPKVRNGATFEDVIKIVDGSDGASMKDVQKKLNRRKTVVYEYLRRLEDWKVLTSYRDGIYKVWK